MREPETREISAAFYLNSVGAMHGFDFSDVHLDAHGPCDFY